MNVETMAREFAVEAHGEQRYGEHPYAKHLDDVAELVRAFGPSFVVVAYLHDVYEDTEILLQTIADSFGLDVAHAVETLTDPPGPTRRIRKKKLHSILSRCNSPLVLVVKAADRLANVAECVKNEDSRLEMYRREHAEFRKAVYRPGMCDELWHQLDQLMEFRDV